MAEEKVKTDLDERYTVNEFDCGCLIRSEFQGGLGQKWISYCRVHKAAFDMLDALQIINTKALNAIPAAIGFTANDLQDIAYTVEQAISKAKVSKGVNG